ncbi:hypothetical protein GCM10007868_12670 [Gluconobacter frateurii]|uniref:Uncharacterized protein n=1 Tax=Gluconobacter frateurii NRIC 0228 TaxID=1307946 RepID=A0ABQ0QDJ9_9PROT|nr:hypothetical protein AA0228_2395 [Gluconobacter frateurii NRIC 0228]GLP90192.1 hypothetical protein GCM10007868_12670 [Gluconobacter frateurii]
MICLAALSAEPFRDEEQKTVQDQKTRNGQGRTEYGAEAMFEKAAEDDSGNCRNHEKAKDPNRLKLVVSTVQTQHPAKNGHPVAPKNTRQSHEGSDMEHRQERQEHV